MNTVEEKERLIARNLIIAAIALAIISYIELYVGGREHRLILLLALFIVFLMFLLIARQDRNLHGRPNFNLTIIVALMPLLLFSFFRCYY